MSQYDGPAFYRKFMREGTINKAKKAESLNKRKRQNQHHHLEFASDTQRMDFHKFKPTHKSYHVDLQNNPIARITAAFHPKHHYSKDKTSPDLTISHKRGFQQINAPKSSANSSVEYSGHQEVSHFAEQESLSVRVSRSANDSKFATEFQPLFQSSSPSSSNENHVQFQSLQSDDSDDSNESVPVHQSPVKSTLNSSNSADQEKIHRIQVSNLVDNTQEAYSDNPSPLGHDFASIMHTEKENIKGNLALFADDSTENQNHQKASSKAQESQSPQQSNPPVKKSADHSESNDNSNHSAQDLVDSATLRELTQPHTNLQHSAESESEDSDDQPHHEVNHRTVTDYVFPEMNLLTAPHRANDQDLDDWILNKAEILNKTLKAFKVNAQVVDWTNGPTVTQFQVKLHLGVKVSKIRHLADDLKMALAAKDIRIEAPIPGKTTCGIEIPNPKPRPVMLSEVVNSPEFKNSRSALTVALGVDLSGKPRVTDLRKMPHGLIAGATGSGKSVFINSLLLSLLYKATPEQLRMILIDPKAVELAPYNKIPHLLSPVISEPKQAAAALKWTVKEMNQRYTKLAAAGVRNIEQFNRVAEQHHEPDQKMPYILIVIDELADLMMVASDEVEAYIVRITQKARAAGIHLIVATQRPSVDIVTGTIKNNIPTRVAFMVSSQVDSRTIIDTSGAERLLGKGDMLYLGSGNSHPIRLQGCFVSGKEVDRVTNFVRQQEPAQYAFRPGSLLKKVNQIEKQDSLMPRVLAYIAKEKTISTSKLQRVFSIGYNRAAKLIDALEQHNYISGPQGSKPRDIYLTEDDYKKLNL